MAKPLLAQLLLLPRSISSSDLPMTRPEQLPRSRRLHWVSMLDVKIAARTLLRHPGITVVAVLAIAFGIGVAALGHEIVRNFVSPTLPFEHGERVVILGAADMRDGDTIATGPAQLQVFRENLRSIELVGGWRTRQRNVSGGLNSVEPVAVAEISASAFAVASVQPLLGRTLTSDDERAGAAPVVVIGERMWRARFDGDAAAIGSRLRLGSGEYTLVGVMPDGFGFPIAHSVWTALGEATALQAEESLTVFGRLAAGQTVEHAQAELQALHAADERKDAIGTSRAYVRPYAEGLQPPIEMEPRWLLLINLFFALLVMLVCANVAMLVFARAASRTADIAVRSALGASRARILGHFFVESLILCVVAAAIGLLAAQFALSQWILVAERESSGQLPFWTTRALSPDTLIYTALLTVLAAAIAGLLPARKAASEPELRCGLSQSAAGTAGLRFGAGWLLIIVVQVALSAAFPVAAFLVRDAVAPLQAYRSTVPIERYLTARVELDAASPSRRAQVLAALEARLEREPGITGVSFADHVPHGLHPQRAVDMQSSGDLVPAPPSRRPPRVGVSGVATDYFATLHAQLVAGHLPRPDGDADRRMAVLVNTAFVERILHGRQAVGQRVRLLGNDEQAASPWFDIVGVVPDLGALSGDNTPHDDPALYRPLALGTLAAPRLLVEFDSTSQEIAARLRDLAAEVDPDLRLHDVMSLDEAGATMWLEFGFLYRIVLGISAMALMLSLAGIYAVLSFATVSRTREIGLRRALGARPWQLVAALFKQPLLRVAWVGGRSGARGGTRAFSVGRRHYRCGTSALCDALHRDGFPVRTRLPDTGEARVASTSERCASLRRLSQAGQGRCGGADEGEKSTSLHRVIRSRRRRRQVEHT